MRQQMFAILHTLQKNKKKKPRCSFNAHYQIQRSLNRRLSASLPVFLNTAAYNSSTTKWANNECGAKPWWGKRKIFLISLDACVSTMHTGLACFPSSWNTVTLCSGSNEWQQHYEAMISQKSNAVIKWGGPSLHASKKENTWSWTWPCIATVVWEGGAWKACT